MRTRKFILLRGQKEEVWVDNMENDTSEEEEVWVDNMKNDTSEEEEVWVDNMKNYLPRTAETHETPPQTATIAQGVNDTYNNEEIAVDYENLMLGEEGFDESGDGSFQLGNEPGDGSLQHGDTHEPGDGSLQHDDVPIDESLQHTENQRLLVSLEGRKETAHNISKIGVRDFLKSIADLQTFLLGESLNLVAPDVTNIHIYKQGREIFFEVSSLAERDGWIYLTHEWRRRYLNDNAMVIPNWINPILVRANIGEFGKTGTFKGEKSWSTHFFGRKIRKKLEYMEKSCKRKMVHGGRES